MSDNKTEVPDNVVQVMGRVNRRKSVSLIAGWSWLRYCEGDSNSDPVQAVLTENCPMVSYNPLWGQSMQQLENPGSMMQWLPMVLREFVRKVLLDEWGHSDEHQIIAEGEGWDEFKREIERLSKCDFGHHANKVGDTGIEYCVHRIVGDILMESGILTAIHNCASGRPLLRNA